MNSFSCFGTKNTKIIFLRTVELDFFNQAENYFEKKFHQILECKDEELGSV